MSDVSPPREEERDWQIDERRRKLIDDGRDRCGVDSRRRRLARRDDHAANPRAAEGDRDDRPLPDAVRHLVGERAGDGAGRDERIDGGVRYRPSLETAEER